MSLDFPSTPTNGQIYNGFVWDDTAGVWKKQNNIKFYVASRAGSSAFGNHQVGGIRIYGKKLSASEIQQNFNAIRGRYGI